VRRDPELVNLLEVLLHATVWSPIQGRKRAHDGDGVSLCCNRNTTGIVRRGGYALAVCCVSAVMTVARSRDSATRVEVADRDEANRARRAARSARTLGAMFMGATCCAIVSKRCFLSPFGCTYYCDCVRRSRTIRRTLNF
jgi:hypothetical protein